MTGTKKNVQISEENGLDSPETSSGVHVVATANSFWDNGW